MILVLIKIPMSFVFLFSHTDTLPRMKRFCFLNGFICYDTTANHSGHKSRRAFKLLTSATYTMSVDILQILLHPTYRDEEVRPVYEAQVGKCYIEK